MIVDEEDFSALHPALRECLRHCELQLEIKLRGVFAEALAEVPAMVQLHVRPTLDALEKGLPGAIFRADLEFFKLVSGLLDDRSGALLQQSNAFKS